jgi:hypothetical protein
MVSVEIGIIKKMSETISRALLYICSFIPNSILRKMKSVFPNLAQYVLSSAWNPDNFLKLQLRAAANLNKLNHKANLFNDSKEKKLAVVTPWQPTANGIAEYSKNFCKAMETLSDVSVYRSFIDEKKISTLVNSDVLNLPIMHDYSEIIYQIGNGKHHWLSWNELLVNPGYVIAHDPKIPDIPAFAGEDTKWMKMSYAEKAESFYGRLPVHTKGVFVHSFFAQELILNQLKKEGKSIPVHVLTTGHPIPEVQKRRKIETLRTIGTFGIQNESKCPEPTYRLMSILSSCLNLNGIICGRISKLHSKIAKRIWRENGNEPNRLIITGEVSDDEFENNLDQVDLGIQLRKEANGESSGPLAKLISRGVPSIISDIGAFSEISPDICIKISNENLNLSLAAETSQILSKLKSYQQMNAKVIEFANENTYEKACSEIFDKIKRTNNLS